MIRPTRRSLALLGAGLPLALLPALVAPVLWTAWLGFDAVVVALCLVDVLLGTPARDVRARARAPKLLHLGHDGDLDVRVKIPGARPGQRVEVLCELDGPLQPVSPDDDTAERLLLTVGDNNGVARGKLALEPVRRGTVRCTALWLRWSGPLGLMDRVRRVETDASVAVVPDIHAVREAALRMSRHRNFISGIKRQRYIGDGSEFESLKEYQAGYDHRAIDWKASARQRKLLVRQMEAERNHRIVLAFDTGYLMSQTLDDQPRLDHAIQAGLLLALLSLRQGDRVGMFGFDERTRAWLPPQPGMPTLHRIMEHCALLDYNPVETNFTAGLAELGARLRRRSLIVVLTDFADVVTAQQMIEQLGRLARRHAIIFVSLRDRAIAATAQHAPEDFDTLNRAVVAHDFARDRELVLAGLRRAGVFCIDALPEEVTVQLLNRYLEVKRRGLL